MTLRGHRPSSTRSRSIRVAPETSDRLRELAEVLGITIPEVVWMSVTALVRALRPGSGR